MNKLNVQRTWQPAPGMEKHAGTNRIYFKLHKDKPKYRRATYVRAVCDIRPKKPETLRTRITIEGNLI